VASILQDGADIADALDEGIVRYGNSWPDFMEQLPFRYRSPRVFRQIAQHLHRLGPKREVAAIAFERAAIRVEHELLKAEDLKGNGTHRGL
jgi:hypothetical protein